MSDPPLRLVVPKSTGTHADVLVAVGLADLLRDSAGNSARLVEDAGGFGVMPPMPLSDVFFEGLTVSPGYPFLKANDKTEVPTHAESPIDYKRERTRVQEYRELQEQARRHPELRHDQAFLARMQQVSHLPSWRLLQVLNVLKGHDTSNRVHSYIAAASMNERRQWVANGAMALAAGRPFVPPWTAKLVQIFTPTAAKGYARLKPDSTQRGDSTKEQWIDPFAEWLKYRGYFRVACPHFVGAKGEHIRMLIPVPADITVQALSDIATQLRGGRGYASPPKLDSLKVLDLAALLIEHSVEYHLPDVPGFQELLMHGRSPAQIISGVMITQYQSLGSAKAVSAMSTLALPDWFTVSSAADADLWRAILDEHRRVLRSLKDDRSDEIGLLIQYRRFLERRAKAGLWALMEFMGAYGQFLIRAREQKRRVPAFTAHNFRGIVVRQEPDYGKILDDPGFVAVAAAVRRATVSAQAQKAMKKKDYRDIRYDLIPELRRKRSLADSRPFLEVVAEFISAYNVENARRREMGKQTPGNVRTEEFAAFCKQVEVHGASLIGALLCAYGTCRTRYEAASDEQEPEDADRDGPDNEGAEEE